MSKLKNICSEMKRRLMNQGRVVNFTEEMMEEKIDLINSDHGYFFLDIESNLKLYYAREFGKVFPGSQRLAVNYKGKLLVIDSAEHGRLMRKIRWSSSQQWCETLKVGNKGVSLQELVPNTSELPSDLVSKIKDAKPCYEFGDPYINEKRENLRGLNIKLGDVVKAGVVVREHYNKKDKAEELGKTIDIAHI